MKKILLLIATVTVLVTACKKDPGLGGDAAIRGKVHVKHYNSTFTQFIGEYDGADLYVYITYGNHVGYDTRIKSDYKGEFEFRYLYPGDYKVYLYSIDSTLTEPSGTVAVVNQVHLNGRKEQYDLGTIDIFN
ncbi:MAG: hypothetical protein ABI723_04715 [Bacteroidia bacterium]